MPAEAGTALPGLSPHVRGNPARDRRSTPCSGSIPARAGEPGGTRPGRTRGGVYPRTCGGTWSATRARRRGTGLSPHVRGNHFVQDHPDDHPRSIPARAGEPGGPDGGRSGPRVYPRTCGGTFWPGDEIFWQAGLSPHVRGNLGRGVDRDIVDGSIPARAGEPRPAGWSKASRRVYPRTCGGTPEESAPEVHKMGLSPHVRGNRSVVSVTPRYGGSIPARAGEPRCTGRTRPATWVYPRTCGGTTLEILCRHDNRGLSPHVRGNRGQRPEDRVSEGSIPARAGEPTRHRATS